MLRRGLRRKGFVAGGRELEANEPLARDAVASGIGRSKLPAARCLQGEIGKVSAGAGSIERSFRDVSRGIYVNANRDAHGALNGGASSVGDFGQNLFENFTTPGRWRAIARRICGWNCIGAHRNTRWSSGW